MSQSREQVLKRIAYEAEQYGYYVVPKEPTEDILVGRNPKSYKVMIENGRIKP